ncbi:MAG: hypothetical protein GX434_09680 [Peptococcaceae bacterium]|nr:hypothetical protein [Peptococcaceae bacterium]
MRQVRKKSADPAARPYLLKARQEGLELSWNRFESMLPQDGFGKLGLTCFECLQGPCRLNPFSQNEELTICGRSKEDLVGQNLLRILNQSSDAQEVFVADNPGSTLTEKLLKTAQMQIEEKKKNRESLSKEKISKQVGLGVLREDKVNICLEGITSSVLKACAALAEEMTEEAVNRGAKGYNLVLAGDVTPHYPVPTVSNAGGVEFAILSGIVDLYAVGKTGLGLGKNVVSAYHTVYRDAPSQPEKEEIKDWFVQAAVAYGKRNKAKVLLSDQNGQADLLQLNRTLIKAHLDQGSIRKICVLTGGSSVAVQEDALLCEAAVKLAAEDVLCLAIGNAAATLGKYGLLASGAKEASANVTRALGTDQGAPVYWAGSETEILEVLDLIEGVGAERVLAIAPELSTSGDLQTALALAGAGVKVFTAVQLPVYGCEKVARDLDELISSCAPTDFVERIIAEL